MIQTAWGLAVIASLRARQTLLGSLPPGRDMRIKDTNADILGLASDRFTIPCRVPLDDGKSIAQVLSHLSQRYIESLPHQTYPLDAHPQRLSDRQRLTFNSFAIPSIARRDLYFTRDGTADSAVGTADAVEVSANFQIRLS